MPRQCGVLPPRRRGGGRGENGTAGTCRSSYGRVKKSLQKVSGAITILRINSRDKIITFVTASTILLQKFFDNTIGRCLRVQHGAVFLTCNSLWHPALRPRGENAPDHGRRYGLDQGGRGRGVEQGSVCRDCKGGRLVRGQLDILVAVLRADRTGSASHTFRWRPPSSGVFRVTACLWESMERPVPLCAAVSESVNVVDKDRRRSAFASSRE